MDIEDLRSFLAVVEHNGFRRAAEAMYVSQPALTRRIARLEQELKVVLLERSRHGVRPTTQGEALLSGARRVLATVEEARASASGTWSQHIVIACTTTAVGSDFLTDFLASWIPAHRTTRVRMIEDSPARTRRQLMDHECHAAIAAPPFHPNLDSLPISGVEVQALLPPGHHLAGTGPLSVVDLHHEPVLVIGEQFRSTKLLQSACRLAAVEPEIVFECSAGSTLEALVRAGAGIGIISDAVQRAREDDLVTRPLCDVDGRLLTFELHIAWVRSRILHPAVHEFTRDLSRFTAPIREAQAARTRTTAVG